MILACPKCGSMVEVVPPPGWKPKPEPTPEETSATAAVATGTAGTEPSGRNQVGSSPGGSGGGTTIPQMAPELGASAASGAVEATADTWSVPTGPADPTPTIGRETLGGAPRGELDGSSPIGVAPAEVLWGKWLLLATIPVAALVIGVTAWRIISLGQPEEAAPKPIVEAPAEGEMVVEQPLVEEDPATLPLRLDTRWLPRDTKLLCTLGASALAGREEFGLAISMADSVWQPVMAEFVAAFGLELQTIRRLSWASTDLGSWPDYGVIVVEFEPGQDARLLGAIGEEVDIELGGGPCRCDEGGRWPHPFAIIDELTMVTGREELLRGLADRSDGGLASETIAELLQAAGPDKQFMMLLDVAAARQSGWRLPNSLMDVWPAGREAWHTVWEVPVGLGISVQRGDRTSSEIAILCKGETAASNVHAALDELIPAAKVAIQTQAESLPEKITTGQIAAGAADQYELLLACGETALQSTRWEVVDQTVWVRVDWGQDPSSLIAVALGSRPTIRSQWFDAALVADQANHRRILTGLGQFVGQEGAFPEGAGGSRLLPPETRLSWIAGLLPYYGHDDWHRELQFGYSWNSKQNRAVTRRRLDLVVNPALGPGQSEAGFPVTHYVGLAGVGAGAADLLQGHPQTGVFGFGRKTRLNGIADGASNTIAILGVSQRLGSWAAGGPPTVRALTQRPYVNGPDGFGSGQPNGMLVGMADGSVRFISSDVDPTVLEQLATIGGGENVTVAALDVHRVFKPPQADEGVEPVQTDEPPVAEAADSGATTVEPSGEATEVDVELLLAGPVQEIDFPNVPLLEVVELFSNLSALPITLDTDALNQLGVDVRDPIAVKVTDTTVGKALEVALASRGLVYVVEKSQLHVTTPDEKRTSLYKVKYTVFDLTGSDSNAERQLAESVQKLVDPDSWNKAGGRGNIESVGGALDVFQTGIVHHQVLTFCEKLRNARGIPLKSRYDPAIFALDTRFDRAREKLAQPVSANFHHRALLVRVLSDLEQLCRIRILVDWMALATQEISRQAEATLVAKNLSLSEALDALLLPLGLAYRVIDANTLEITTAEVANARLELEFYRVTDLLSEDVTAGALTEQLKDKVGGATWSDAGGPAVLQFDQPSGCLIVLQSQAVQFQLESLLAQRRAGGRKTAP